MFRIYIKTFRVISLLARLLLLPLLVAWLTGCAGYEDDLPEDKSFEYANNSTNAVVMTGTWLFDNEPAGTGEVSLTLPDLLQVGNLPLQRFVQEWSVNTGVSGWNVDKNNEGATLPMSCRTTTNAYSSSNKYNDLATPEFAFPIVSADGRHSMLRILFGQQCYAMENIELSTWTIILGVSGFAPVDDPSLPQALFNQEKILKMTAR